MKGRKKRYGLIIIIVFLFCIGLLLYLNIKNQEENKPIEVLNSHNIKRYETIFNQKLDQYVSKENEIIKVKDITDSDLNNAYRGDELIGQDCFPFLGMLSIETEEEVNFGVSYEMPALFLKGNSNLLFSDESNEYWEVTEETVKITYNFDILTQSIGAEPDIEIGAKANRNFISASGNYKNGHFEGHLWLFKGDCFYPWINNTDNDEVMIVNGRITIVRDDIVQKN